MILKKIKEFLRSFSIALAVSKTIDQIKDASCSLIFVPFRDVMVPVYVRELTPVQILACGQFSLIETFQDKINKPKKITLDMALQYADRHHDICKKALVAPRYDDLIQAVGGDSMIDAKKTVQELKEKLKGVPMGPERDELDRQIDAAMVWTDLVLPDEFTASIVSYVLGIDKSDIKSVSHEILLRAAILAKNGHDNPADHVSGVFTDFMRDDINSRAWAILREEQEKKKGNKHGC